MYPFLPAEFQLPVTEPDINNRLESLCLSMTEHALGGQCVFPHTAEAALGNEKEVRRSDKTGNEQPWGAAGVPLPCTTSLLCSSGR